MTNLQLVLYQPQIRPGGHLGPPLFQLCPYSFCSSFHPPLLLLMPEPHLLQEGLLIYCLNLEVFGSVGKNLGKVQKLKASISLFFLSYAWELSQCFTGSSDPIFAAMGRLVHCLLNQRIFELSLMVKLGVSTPYTMLITMLYQTPFLGSLP